MKSFLRILALLVACWLSLPGDGQAQVLFSEDFEGGGPGWTASGTPEVLWHVTDPGECGAVTRMAAYNRFPTACDYRTGGPSSGSFLSPVFTLSGIHSFVVQFDYMQETDEGSPCVELIDEASGKATTIIGCSCCADPFGATEVSQAAGAVPDPDSWSGKQVRLRFRFEADSDGNFGFGCMVDNIRVIASGPPEVVFFEDFENGAAGWTMATEGAAYTGPLLWHVARAEECDAGARSAAYNRAPAACSYDTPRSPNAGRLRSPAFTFTGAPPFTIEFLSRKEMDALGDSALLHVVDPITGITSSGGPFPNSATAQALFVTIDPAGFWSFRSGRRARLEFAVNADAIGNLGAGWMVDSVRVTNAGSLPAQLRTDAPPDLSPSSRPATIVLTSWSGYPTLGESWRQEPWSDSVDACPDAIPRTMAVLGVRLKTWR